MTASAPDRSPGEVVIGLDVGTTAVKAVAFGVGSAWRRTAVREYPLLTPRRGRQVQDPDTIAAAVFSALRACAEQCAGSRLLAVSVSAAMHGLIGLDAGHKPLTPLVTWADDRARGEAAELRAAGRAAALHRATGAPVHPMTPLTKLMWFHRAEPELCAEVRWWVGLKDYVLWLLTGSLVTELSSASGTGLLDLSTRTWHPAAVDLAGVAPGQLPDVLPTTSLLPLSAAAAGESGLPSGTPVCVGAADGPLGNLGSQAMEPGTVGLSLGTSGAVRAIVPEPFVAPGGRLFCYALTDTAWAVGGAVSNGSVVMRWAGRTFGDGSGDDALSDEAVLALAASVPAGCDGLVMLPYLLAERAPLWDPDVPGAYLGVRHSHTRGHFVRAAMEGVALQLSTVVDELDRIEPVKAVQVTGGAFRSPLWTSVIAAVLDRPVHLVADAEGSALGAAALGLHALGRAPRLADAPALLGAPAPENGVPVPASPADTELYRTVRAAIPRLLSSYTAVADLFA
ncbi:gluconokinase [Streptomyces cavernicola]|uniref:Gluconokinase n=1 Tax=Streptomyces cavernicola TaxID=3043613 RepID=A0ABT6S5P5_9ACTN|nr:gluconokinase [Streptomyces sp. B-S-A6]MDI3403405.1 gluconokinase [Streptomyces sp. B-S-A6]